MPKDSAGALTFTGGRVLSKLYDKFNGGLNVRMNGNLIHDDQLQTAENIAYEASSGAIIVRNGRAALFADVTADSGNRAAPTGALAGMQQAIIRSGSSTLRWLLVAGQNGGINTRRTTDSNWTDIIGALVRVAPTNGRVWFSQNGNLVIGSDGTNAPFKSTTAYNTAAALLGGSPPTGELNFQWNGYHFITRNPAAPNRVYYSEQGLPESWPAANYFDVPSPDDGDPIMGYGFTYGNLIIYKRRSIHLITGKVASEFRQDRINDAFGMVNVQSCCSVENTSWFISDRGPYEINGVNIKFLGFWVEPRYRTIVGNHTLNDTKPIAMFHYRQKNQVWVAVDYNNDGVYDRIMVHDYWNKDKEGQPAVSEITYTQTRTLTCFSFYTLTIGAPFLFARYDPETSGQQEWLIGAGGAYKSGLNHAIPMHEDYGSRDNDGIFSDCGASNKNWYVGIVPIVKFKYIDFGDANNDKHPLSVFLRGQTVIGTGTVSTTPDTVTDASVTFTAVAGRNMIAGATRNKYVALSWTLTESTDIFRSGFKVIVAYQIGAHIVPRRN